MEVGGQRHALANLPAARELYNYKLNAQVF
jgi:hypothetical protein